MTFRVEDLTVSLLPERIQAEDFADCTQCTKCTAETGDPTDCSNPSGHDCSCGSKPTKRHERELETLRAQLDEFLASVHA
jgi:hypothetical protein